MTIRHALLRPGIRRRLFVFALSLSLPLGVVAVVRAVERQRSEQERLAERSQRTATRATQLLDDDVNRARTLLAGASRVLDPDAPVARNSALVREIFGDASVGFTNIWVADTFGVLQGQLVPADSFHRPTRLRNLAFFDDVMRTRGFVIGQPIRSLRKGDSSWVIPFAAPVMDVKTGLPRGVVGAGMRMDRMAAMRLARDLPPNSVMTVLRQDGRVFLRSVDMEGWHRRTFAGTTAFRDDPRRPASLQPVRSLDGTERLVALDTMSTLPATVYVGIPENESLLLVRRQFVFDMLVGLLATLVTIFVALLLAQRITDPLLQLNEVATALTHGARDRRAAVQTDDEIGALAIAMNGLADAVQDREAALEASETRYRQLFDTSPLPTLTWRLEDGCIAQANDAARAFYGASQLDAPGVRISDLIQPDERERFARLPVPPTLSSISAGTWSQRDATGATRLVELYIGTLEQTRGALAVGVVLDVTERHSAAAELERSRDQLRQAQKLEALGAFAGGIAHDFNNYLSAIATNAEMLHDDLPEGSALRTEATEILGAAQRASTLTRQILVFSRRQVVHEERIDMNVALQELRHLLTRLVGDRVTVHLACSDDTPMVMFDRGRLEQVLMNLAANARDAMPNGGTLDIVTTRTSTGDACLCVRDTGEGMPAEVVSRIFEPFFTTKTRDKGTGLGLAMVYSIVIGARGTIRVNSTPNVGTEIVITLPGVGPLPEREHTPVAAPSRQRGGEHVLIVEDDAAVRAATASLLARAGYRITVAESAEHALQLLPTLPDVPALLLSDVIMPGASGPELAAQVRQRWPDVRVVFMSGYADDDVLMQGLATHTLHLVAKPFSADEMLNALRRALDEAPDTNAALA
jgi:PAS domain S-box-containing protein